jgi:hypothetical protein
MQLNMVEYVVLETGYTYRYEPQYYDKFEFVGSVGDNGDLIESNCASAEALHAFLRLHRGYLIFRTKPDIQATQTNVQGLIEQINTIPYCAFFEWSQLIFTTSTPWVHDEQIFDIIIYTFDTESG